MEDCKVTIIVGIYNSGNFLKKGLDSLVNQTWKNIEVIMMDDGSSDNSPEICDEYEKKDKRFIAVHKKNTGVCDSRNIGIDMATGDYLCFMDGDDWFSEDFVEYMMKIIKETNSSMAFSDKLFTTNDNIQIEKDKIETWDSEKAITSIIYPYMVLGPWNKMYSTKVIKENNIRFPEHWHGETLHFASTVAYYSGKVGVGHRKVYNYRLDNIESGTTVIDVTPKLLSIDNALNLQKCVFAKNSEIMKAIKWHIHMNYSTLLATIVCCDQKDKYSKEYDESLTYLKKYGFKVLMQSKVNFKEKLKIVLRTYFPFLYVKIISRKMKKRIKKLSK